MHRKTTRKAIREYIEECKHIFTWRNCPGVLIIHTGGKINKICRLLLYYKQQTNGSVSFSSSDSARMKDDSSAEAALNEGEKNDLAEASVIVENDCVKHGTLPGFSG